MPSPARSVAVAMDATPLLGVRTGVGESVAGFIVAVATDPDIDVDRVRPQRNGREVPPRTAARFGAARATDPDPGRRVAPDVGPLRPSGSRTVDRPRRRGARHQLRRATFPQGGAARDRARPDSRALPRVVQPDIAAVPRPDPPGRRAGRLHPHGLPIDGGRRHGPLPCRRRSGARHPQRADSAAASPRRARSRNLRTSSPSEPSSRARASPTSWRPSTASADSVARHPSQDRRAARLGRGRVGCRSRSRPAQVPDPSHRVER